MSDADKRYFLRRAEAELELAQRGDNPKAVAAHYRLAELYLDRVYTAPAADGTEVSQP